MADIDKLFARSYEDNVLGNLEDRQYRQIAINCSNEQAELEEKLIAYEKELVGAEQKDVDSRMLYKGLMEFLEIKKLTPEIVNKVIKKIEVHNPEKKHAYNSVKIDITFTAIGLFSIPEEEELLEMAKQAQAETQRALSA